MLCGPFRKLVGRVCVQRKFVEESLYGLRCGEEWPGHSIGSRFGSRLCLPLRCSVSILWHCLDPYLVLGYNFAAAWRQTIPQPYKVKICCCGIEGKAAPVIIDQRVFVIALQGLSSQIAYDEYSTSHTTK